MFLTTSLILPVREEIRIPSYHNDAYFPIGKITADTGSLPGPHSPDENSGPGGACFVLRAGYPAASFNSAGPLLKDNSIRLAPLQTSQTSRNFTHTPGAPRSASTGTWLGSAGSDRRVSTHKDSRTPPESFHDSRVMALHIRDFRQTDAAGLSRLATAAHQLGDLPEFTPGGRILVGLREDHLSAAIWFKLEGQTGIVDAIVVTRTALWQSDVQELIAEASL